MARRILVPLDFTRPSMRACDLAIDLGAPVGASIGLVHVIERFDVPLNAGESASLVSGATEELARIARLVGPHVRAVETLVVEGEAAAAIDAAARDWAADLVVMGTHGRSGLARAFLGSVAARVVRRASVPVTTVPEYVAASRNDAGAHLAKAMDGVGLENPDVIALSRGALTIATALAERMRAPVDYWVVEPVLTSEGRVLGALGEDDRVELDDGASVTEAKRSEAVALARRRSRAEVLALKSERRVGEHRNRDVVLVADGLFSAAYARVAARAFRKLGARKIVVASPIVARAVTGALGEEVDAVIALEQATVTDGCAYRDDVLPSELVAYELLHARAPRQTG